MNERVLIVEDKESHARMLEEALRAAGLEPRSAGDVKTAQRLIAAEIFDVIISDLRLPDGNGLEVLESGRRDDPERSVIIMTAFGTIDDAVRAMRGGAVDFIQKPVDVDHLIRLVQRAIEVRRLRTENIVLREENQRSRSLPVIIGESAAIRRVAEDVRRVASTDATVLLQGESGTGKELFARAIHELSPRAGRPFVAINCAAIPETLLENELFGHEKGSFTGATARQMGKFELATGGSIFLDEIGELGASTQAKLLRVLQERSFDRIGGTRTVHVDVRVICATNRELATLVSSGLFREDLYYRICVFPVTIPPLRERREDIPLLVEHILARLRREMGKPSLSMSEDAVRVVQESSWPGNVRELQNALERAAILSDGVIEPRHIRHEREEPAGVVDMNGSLPEVAARAAERAERARIAEELPRYSTRAALAEALGVNVRTLNNKLRQYGLDARSGTEEG